MKKGFTLVELLGVIALLGLLILIVYPTVMEQIEKKQNEVISTKAKLIYSGAELYVSEHPEEYPFRVGNQYCISIATLVAENKIAIDVSDIKQKGVQLTFGNNHKITSRLVEQCDLNDGD